MENLTGQVLGGRYRVETFLGRGGMADVYKVWDDQRAVYLALKVLHSDLAEDIVFLRRFEREAETLARLQHPNIVRFYGLETATDPESGETLACILMDFIDGLTLRKEIFLSKGGLREDRILQIMRPVCAALNYAHKLHLVHCDIKPVNIMIHRNGTVYVTDFGITRVTEAATHTLIGAGTPAYMAPEQINGDEPTPAADVYALGVVLFEMVTGGQRPYTGESAGSTGSTLQKIVWEKNHLPAPSPRIYRPDLSPALETVILHCLENDPNSRYATTLDLLHALERAIQGPLAGAEMGDDLGTLADINQPSVPDISAYRERFRAAQPLASRSLNPADDQPVGVDHWLEKRRMPLAITLTVILLLLSAAGILFLRQNPGGSPGATSTPDATAIAAIQASFTTQPTTGSPAQPATATQPVPTPTASPAPTVTGGSQQIAFASDRSGTVQVWVMDENGEHRRQVTKAEGGACQPSWSPDGIRIAYTTPCSGPRITYPGANIRMIDLNSGQILTPNLPGGAFDPAWSPLGDTILYTTLLGDQTQIGALSIKDDQFTHAILATRAGKNANPAWSPDGQHIAFTSVDKKVDQIWIMDKDGSSQEVFTQSSVLKYFSRPQWSPDGKMLLANLKELNINIPTLVLFNRSNPRAGEASLHKDLMRMEDGSFSPDGLWVTFWTVMEGNNMEIMRISLAGNLVQLTDHGARDFHPDWGPK